MHTYARLGSILSGAALVAYGGYRVGTGDVAAADAPKTPVTAEAPQQGAIRFEQWRDPRERAFTIDAPVGWRMQGGMFRIAPVDLRGAWQATSPDGAVTVSGGDPDIPPFTVPNQTLSFAGFPEGSWYPPPGGRGLRVMVRRYEPGLAFARDYVTRKFGGSCSNVTFTENRERRDAVAALNEVNSQFASMGMSVRLDAGEVRFTCHRTGRPMEGYYFAATMLAGNENVAQWAVSHLYGFIAPPAKARQAQSVLDHMLGSFVLSEEWSERQGREVMRTSDEVRRENDVIRGILRRSWESRDPDRVIRNIP